MLLSLIGFYAVGAIIALVVLAKAAGKKATGLDICIGALVWPYVTVKYIQLILND